MNQATVVEAIGKHLDALASTVNWIVVFAAVASWVGLRRENYIEAFGVKVERRLAFYVASVIYLIANVMVLILFLRLGDLLLLVKPQNVSDAVASLATHTWLLNPYSYFGEGRLARFHSSEGYGLLITTWWLCSTSLSTLDENKYSRVSKLLVGIFLGIGVLTMQAIQRNHDIIISRLPQGSLLLQGIQRSSSDRVVGNFLGILVGGLLFLAVNLLQERWLREKKPRSPTPTADA